MEDFQKRPTMRIKNLNHKALLELIPAGKVPGFVIPHPNPALLPGSSGRRVDQEGRGLLWGAALLCILTAEIYGSWVLLGP